MLFVKTVWLKNEVRLHIRRANKLTEFFTSLFGSGRFINKLYDTNKYRTRD